MERIGIFGGTFNPLHNGHLIFAQKFTEQLGLLKCLFVPAYISPFKTDDYDDSNNMSHHRIEMLKLGISSNPKFSLDLFEIEKKGISYTIDTVKYIQNIYKNSQLFLLIGYDQIVSFKEWKEWKNILEIVQLCVLIRPKIIVDIERITHDLKITFKKPIIINTPLLDISSTDIRKRVSDNLPINELVTPEIESYILSNNLYKK